MARVMMTKLMPLTRTATTAVSKATPRTTPRAMPTAGQGPKPWASAMATP